MNDGENGYGDQYRDAALIAMAENGWLPAEYTRRKYAYERENCNIK